MSRRSTLCALARSINQSTRKERDEKMALFMVFVIMLLGAVVSCLVLVREQNSNLAGLILLGSVVLAGTVFFFLLD